jgi:TPR repeat protein
MFRRLLAAIGHPASALERAKGLAKQGQHTGAFRLLTKAAEMPEAARLIGEAYLRGEGVPANGGQALRWLHIAADAGDAGARTRLAALALQGVHHRSGGLFGESAILEPDYAGAASLCRLADTPEARALLAFILTSGPQAMRDPHEAEALYRRSAAGNWPQGHLGVAAILLARGDPGAKSHLLAAMDGGVAAADYLLGTMAESDGAFAEAVGHYRCAADAGYVPAQQRLGFALLAGRGVPADAFQAENWLRKAALAGDVPAAAVAGFLNVRDGNPVAAEPWLRMAAERGHAGAARTLGYLLVRSDPAEAARWLYDAAAAGDAEAKRMLRAIGPLQNAA